MKAIFSLHTGLNGTSGCFGFTDAEAFGCSAVLAVGNAHRFFDQVELYSDPRGAALLRRLGLDFAAWHPAFDTFPYPPQLWMASKLEVYRQQAAPFVHLDLDAYLWQPLPPQACTAPVLVQSREDGWQCYPAALAHLLTHAGYLPDFLRDFVAQHGHAILAVNAGVFGGCDVRTIQRCAQAALDIITHPANARLFAQLPREAPSLAGEYNILLEQYLAAVYCYQHHIEVRCVLNGEEPYFTHLLSDTKRHLGNVANLKARVRQEYPAGYARARTLTL